jgi:hypothetical protein
MTVRKWLLRWPALALLGVVALAAAQAPAADNEEAAKKTAESEARLKRDITYLASDECEGRGPMTKGLDRAADYVAGEFKKAGLKPGNPDGTYFQPYTVSGNILEAPPRLALKGPTGQEIVLKDGVQFVPIGTGGNGKLSAPVVFAGYGLTVKNQTADYDDYAGLDVEGKVVVVLRESPRAGDRKALGLAAGFRSDPTSLATKLDNAEKHKAAAVLVVNDAETAKTGDDLFPYSYTAFSRNRSKVPALQIRRSVLQAMLQGSAAADLRDLEHDIDGDLKPRSMDLKGWSADLDIQIKWGEVPVKNVVGVLEGNGPLAKEYVVVSSHLDHLGYGGAFGSLARLKRPAIHHGADDNGSGSTSVMELARRFAAIPNRQGRTLIFITFTGEEMGLLGSRYYANHPLYPMADTVADLNLDMVGRVHAEKEGEKDFLLVEGANTGKDYKDLVDELNKKYDFVLKYGRGVPGNSDHFSFYQKGVPVLFFWNGLHPDYHRPSDTADKINIPGMRKVVELSEEVLTNLTTRGQRPEFVKIGAPERPARGINIGIVPKRDEGEGVLLDSVTEGGPAARAGLKAGDRIVEIAGKPVKDYQAYVEMLRGLEPRGALEVTIVRDGKKQNVTLGLVPSIGLRPKYGDAGEGVLLDGVTEGTPAEKAGLKAGDRIIEVAGKPVKDIEGYVDVLQRTKIEGTLELTILRDGKKQTVKVKLD